MITNYTKTNVACPITVNPLSQVIIFRAVCAVLPSVGGESLQSAVRRRRGKVQVILQAVGSTHTGRRRRGRRPGLGLSGQLSQTGEFRKLLLWFVGGLRGLSVGQLHLLGLSSSLLRLLEPTGEHLEVLHNLGGHCSLGGTEAELLVRPGPLLR